MSHKRLPRGIAQAITAHGGVYKRMDEVRELMETLAHGQTDVLHKYPWVEGWLRSTDQFLGGLAEAFQTADPSIEKAYLFRRRDCPGSEAYPRRPWYL